MGSSRFPGAPQCEGNNFTQKMSTPVFDTVETFALSPARGVEDDPAMQSRLRQGFRH